MLECDVACARIARPADEVTAFLADPYRLDQWSFGTWESRVEPDGLVHGRSLQTGAAICVRIEAKPDLGLIDYHIGTTPDDLVLRIFARVLSGPSFGGMPEESALMLTALRGAGMDEQRWSSLKAAHAFEVTVIKAALETGFDHRKALNRETPS